ncbi:MAG: hypothetical protein WD513_07340 [Balneolaceae bacterium]
MKRTTLLFLLPVLTLFLILTGFYYLQTSTTTPQSIGDFTNSLDIGEVSNPGNAHYHPSNQTYTIDGSGHGVGGTSDQFHYLWNSIQGDFILRAELHHDLTDAGQPFQFGWSVRNTITPDSEMISLSVSSDGETAITFRSERSDEAITIVSEDTFPDVIQLERVDGIFKVRTARMGEPFTVMAGPEVNLNNQVIAGLFVNSEGSDDHVSVSFRNVRFVKPFPENEQRYQRYLGSRMEILDVFTGMREVVFESEHSVQAPNWTVDGEKLIYNSNGYLYSYEVNTGHISYLNTGFATNNNNDHVLTFDGEQIAISHHVPEDNNQSTIFMLPIEGSDNPRQVTGSGLGNAYLHGVSPDNQKVIFTGWRNDKYDLYAADVNTMEETQLTDTPFLDDGSEYSPDGEYIYFNSNRTGTMQLWRMKPDGSEQTQLTFDENFNDWFPHISPDGEWILFISYGTDVASGDHPYYKHVTLRLMPVSGGEPEIVAYLYGGQGTINVPSWSPDSRSVAFVSNSGRFY